MQSGELIAGRFRVEAHVGSGGMGVVYRARDEAGMAAGGGRLVAVKLLRADFNALSASTERFVREAEALAALHDPVLVGYVAHGLSEHGPYLALEWVEGPTLAARLRGKGLTPVETVQLGSRVLQGLCVLHGHGIVHRDLKPSNLMLPGDDAAAVRLLDLGIARFADASVELTVEGSQLGTPRYMAPEQIRDPRRVDGRADVFALGCVMFECLTGVPAFPGADPVTVLAQILFGQPLVASEYDPALPEPLDQLLSKLLTRNPALRPHAGPALLAELERLLVEPMLQLLVRMPTRLAQPQLTAALACTLAQADVVDAPAHDTLTEASRVRPSVPPLLVAAVRDAPLRALPKAARPWLGREQLLCELATLLEEGTPLSLWGGAGIGKTRLALELVQRALLQGRVTEDSVLWCDLSAARDSRDVVRACAEQLGLTQVAPVDAENQAGRLFAKLGRLWIVLDRAEHLTRELEPLLVLWRSYAPELRILVTSRVRLRSTREHALEPLAHRPRAELAHWSQEAAPLPLTASASLVVALAREADFVVDTPELEAQAEAIASALDGNPLAIELAMARLPLLGFRGILERLSAQLTLLGEQRSDKTMRQALAWSWQLLSPAERAAFMQCSVFCAPFTLEAAESVLELSAPASTVMNVLGSLREQSLLSTRHEGAGPARLALPAVVREFAREQLTLAAPDDPVLAGTAERHAQYALRDVQLDVKARTLGSEDVIAAVELSLAGETRHPARALLLTHALERQLLAAGSGSRLALLLEQTITVCEAQSSSEPPYERALLEAYQLRARLLAPAGERARAEQDLRRVLARALALEEPLIAATALLDLGVVRHFAADLEQACDYYERALSMLAELDDPVAEARCHGNLGAVHHDRSDLYAAAAGYRRALALLPESGQERLVANFQSNLALVEHELGDTQAARRLYVEACALLTRLLDARLLGIVLSNFGSLELADHRPVEALQHFSRAAALLEQSGDRRSEGLSLARLAVGLALAGHVPEAEQRLARAERLLRKDAIGRAVVELLSGFIDLRAALHARDMAQPALCRHHLQAAREKCNRALSLRERSDDLRLYLALLETQLEHAAPALNG